MKSLFRILFGSLFTLAVFLILAMASIDVARAGTTHVGNGDEGIDLENPVPLKTGTIVEAKQKAVEHLHMLGTEGIPGLGNLIPEVERTPLFSVGKDVPADEALGGSRYHADMRGYLYASTFAQPNSPTRFYPAAKSLTQDQLVALEIHEALHRALPESIREDEKIVSQITLAMTSPEATHDRIREVVAKYMPEDSPRMAFSPSEGIMSEDYPIPDSAKVKRPSILAYSYTQFDNRNANADGQMSPLNSMQTIQSFLYPFGSDRNPIGIGIELSFLNRDQGGEMGPLNLSGRMRLWSVRGFDVAAWVTASLNTLSAVELKNTPYGRDVYSAGLSAQKDLPHFYIENILGITGEGTSNQTVGNIQYNYDYGRVINAKIRAGGKLGMFHVGAFGELFLADYYRVTGGAFSFDSGRYEIASGGPEVTFEFNNFSVGVYGRFILQSSQDATFDYLGNIMGQGVGQGSIGGTLAIKL